MDYLVITGFKKPCLNKISYNLKITTDYGTTNDNEENTLSLVVKKISDICIKIIETLVLIISNIISTLL